MKRQITLALLAAAVTCSPGFAQEWAEKMFEATSHDFGLVARDALTEFEFKLKNLYVKDVHIADVRSSCGCTTPRIEKPWLKTYEVGAIVAHFNTDKFTGRKGATLTVTIDKPQRAVVQLHVRGEIHNGVVIPSGSVQLGDVDQGTAAEKQVRFTSSSRITGVKSSNDYLSAEVVPVRDSRGGSAYELRVRLSENATPGPIRDHLVLVTSDYRRAQVPVLVEGRVQSAVTVSPATLFMGVVKPGQKVVKPVVVRGSRPFRIKSFSQDGASFEMNVAADQASKPLHIIPVTFIAGQEPGKVNQTIRIETDLSESPTDFQASAVIAAAM